MKDKNIEELYQSSNTEKSPANLDNFILAQARNSCNDKQVIHNKPRRNRWLFSLSSAAVVVLSFSVILNLQHENEFDSQSSKIIPETIQKTIPENVEKTNPKVKLEYKTSIQQDSVEHEEKPAPTEINDAEILGRLTEPMAEESADDSLTSYETISPSAPITKDERNDLSRQKKKVSSAPEITPVQAISYQNNYSSGLANDADKTKKREPKKARKIQTNKQPNSTGFSNYSDVDVSKDMQAMLLQQLMQLDTLIDQLKLKDAKKLLKQLQQSYPNYDFSQYSMILNN